MQRIVIFFFVILLSFSLDANISNAQNDRCSTTNDLNVIQKCLDDLIAARTASQKATSGVQQQIAGIKARVNFIENDLIVKQEQVDEGFKELEKTQEIFDATVRDYYIKSYYNTPFLIFLSQPSASNLTRILAYQRATTDQDKLIITNIALTIKSLQEQSEKLKIEKANLAVVKEKLDKVVTEALAYQATLSSQIAQLSAKQQQILAQRLASLNIPLYASMAGGCSSDIGKSPGFGGAFGLFTYGVPNRVGLNQYGAWGRAKAGQGYEDILRAYYNFDSIEKRDATINVEGYGSYPLDDYVKRIYEVPDSWTDNDLAALKAQAIAARSYALAYTNNGQGSICTTQQCQVFQPNEKGGNWNAAVDATAGLVMVQGGNPIKAWFSSTHGGYVHSSGDIGWSGTSWTKNAQDITGSVNNFSDLKNNAFDKDSPWFYCDWGTRSQYNGTAWLTKEELADIANVIMLVQATGGDQNITKHLYQTDKPNPAGTDTWDAARVKQELQSRGQTYFDSVSSASVSSVDFGGGKTAQVSINDRSFPGDLFKTYFNLRAPANIQIVGPLYNIETQ